MITWQILIPTIPHRQEKLAGLLATLDGQVRPGFSVLIYRDNLAVSYLAKMQALWDAATAEYISVMSDDDSVAPDFVPRCLAAMAERPDQVGFRVRYTEAGVLQLPVIHSLRCGGWYQTITGYYRDFMFFNPVRRELAQRVALRGLVCDEEYAADMRALGIIKTEVFIDDEIFYYMRDSSDNFHSPRAPMAEADIPPLPLYPWCEFLGGDGSV